MEIEDLAKDHVDWFLDTIRPLLITHFVHGYKHGMEYGNETPEDTFRRNFYNQEVKTNGA